jgi:hypothetical protein
VAVRVDVNVKRFQDRMEGMKRRGYIAREAYVLALGAIFVQHVVKFSPRDTHRYVRGWMEAAQGAKLKVGAIPALKPSRHIEGLRKLAEHQLRLTREQIQLEELKLAWYEKASADGKIRPKIGYYHKLVNKIYEAKTRADRAKEELDKALSSYEAIGMMRGSGAALNGYERNLKGTALNLTFRTKVYGGVGRLIRGSTKVALALHNREPHCRVVERYRKPVGKANAALRAAGVEKLKPVYVMELAIRTKGPGGALLRKNAGALLGG